MIYGAIFKHSHQNLNKKHNFLRFFDEQKNEKWTHFKSMYNKFCFVLFCLILILDLDPVRAATSIHRIGPTSTNYEKSWRSSGQQSILICYYYGNCGVHFQAIVRLPTGLWSQTCESTEKKKQRFQYDKTNFKTVEYNTNDLFFFFPFPAGKMTKNLGITTRSVRLASH